MNRPSFIPSPEQRIEVRNLAATGASDEDIAAQLDIPEKKLRKFFRNELRNGAATGRQQALNKLYEIVSNGDNLSALIFWIKAKCGWRDTGPASTGPTICKRVLIIKRDDSGTPA